MVKYRVFSFCLRQQLGQGWDREREGNGKDKSWDTDRKKQQGPGQELGQGQDRKYRQGHEQELGHGQDEKARARTNVGTRT